MMSGALRRGTSYREMIVSLCDYSGAWSRPFLELEPGRFFVVRVDPKHSLTCDHGGNGYGAEGDESFYRMEDGGWALAMTAAQLRIKLEDEGGYFFDRLYERAVGLNKCSPNYDGVECWGLLLAPPCTDYSSSGARWFAAKDADGRTEASNRIVRDCLAVRDLLAPDWWVLENPKGRIASCVPSLGKWLMHFNPADYAGLADHPDREAYSKDTYLYGDFSANLTKHPRDIVWYYDNAGNRGSWQWKHLGGKSERTKELRSMTPTGFARAFAMAQLQELNYPPHEDS